MNFADKSFRNPVLVNNTSRENGMKLKFALCAGVLALVAAQPAEASFKVIRWNTGLCQIWNNATPWNAGPFGWTTVSPNFETMGEANVARLNLHRKGQCW